VTTCRSMKVFSLRVASMHSSRIDGSLASFALVAKYSSARIFSMASSRRSRIALDRPVLKASRAGCFTIQNILTSHQGKYYREFSGFPDVWRSCDDDVRHQRAPWTKRRSADLSLNHDGPALHVVEHMGWHSHSKGDIQTVLW